METGNTRTMDYRVEVPLGRSSALFTFAMATAGSVVLILVSVLSDYKISYLIVYYWNMTLSLVSLAAMLAFVLLRRNTNHVGRCNQYEKIIDGYWIYLFVTILCGLGASMFRWFETVRAAMCIEVMKENYFFVPKFLSELVMGIVWLAELVFIIACRKYQCQSSWSRMLVSVLMSANVSIFVNGVLDVFRAANTETDTAYIPRKSDNDTKESTDYFKRTLVFSTCSNSSEIIDHLAGKINTYVYHFPLAYCLLALCVLGPMWNVITPSVNRDVINTEADRNEIDNLLGSHVDSELLNNTGRAENMSRFRCITILKLSLSVSLKYMSKRPWRFSIAFALLSFALNIAVEVTTTRYGHGNSTTLPRLEDANYYVQTLTTYLICIVTFLGYVVSRKNNPSRWKYNTKNILLGIGTLGQLLLLLFMTVDSIIVFVFFAKSFIVEKVLFVLETMLNFIGVYSQTMLILKTRGIFNNEPVNSLQFRYVNGVVVFLAICNTKIWLANSFLTPPTLAYIEDIKGDDTFGHKHWWLLTRLLYPCSIFYRMFSALMCFELLYQVRNRRYHVL